MLDIFLQLIYMLLQCNSLYLNNLDFYQSPKSHYQYTSVHFLLKNKYFLNKKVNGTTNDCFFINDFLVIVQNSRFFFLHYLYFYSVLYHQLSHFRESCLAKNDIYFFKTTFNFIYLLPFECLYK